MRNLISRLALASALTLSTNAFAQELEIGDKMPPVSGQWLESGICYENQKGSRPGYHLYGVNSFKRKINFVKIELNGKGTLVMKYDRNAGIIYSDLNDNGIIDGVRDYFPTYELISVGLKLICPKLELE
ncbi:MAG: hypothetical protein AABY03_02240 [Nanoarchaeota archaeon]